MAQFKCGSCGHVQPAQDELVGRKAKCPVCRAVGTVAADGSLADEKASVEIPDSAGNATNPPTDQTVRPSIIAIAHAKWAAVLRRVSNSKVMRFIPTLPTVATLLLACSVILQFLILSRLSDKRSAIPVSIRDITTVDRLPVLIDEVGTFVKVPVLIEGVSTRDELRVNLYNHYIIDPIPVEIVR